MPTFGQIVKGEGDESDLPTLAESLEFHLEGPQGVRWRDYTEKQLAFMNSAAKRKMVKAGRRGGKTTGFAGLACKAFLAGRRVLYAGPTADQLDHFWSEVNWILRKPLAAGVFYQHKGHRIIKVPGSRTRIRAKTVWIPDDMRGDFADLLLLDEFQMMAEDVWQVVAQPMLIDHDGDAVFAFTVPSILSQSMSKAKDKLHAIKMFRYYDENPTKDWELFSFTSYDNPHVSQDAINRLADNMSSLAFRQEIMAEDPEEIPGALWKRKMIDDTRIDQEPEYLDRIVVGVDPPGGATECGIVVAAIADCDCQGEPEPHVFILSDASMHGTPKEWSKMVLYQYDGWQADSVIAEVNYGGDMVAHTLGVSRLDVPLKIVHASRGKAIRADPVVALYEKGRVHHVGEFQTLETEMCEWLPGEQAQLSPNRMDALVWAVWSLALQRKKVYRWAPAEGT